MANTTQRHLLEVLKQYCHDVANESSTIKSYEQELMKHIAEIVSLERNNVVGDFQFIVMEKYLSNDNELPFFEKIIMKLEEYPESKSKHSGDI